MARLRKRRMYSSPLQEEVLRFIEAYKADRDNDGNSPTYREIAIALRKHPSTIYSACLRLQSHGLIEVNMRGRIVLRGGQYSRRDNDPSAAPSS